MKNKTYRLRITIFICLQMLFWSVGNSFITAQKVSQCLTPTIPIPKTSIASDEVRFAVIGDTGRGSPEQKRLARTMENIQAATHFNLLLLLGDNIYDNGNPSDFGDKLYAPYERLKNSGVEIRGVVGNHDVSKYIYGVKIQQCYFGMGDDTFYSFSKNNNLVNFFGLDSNLLVNYQPVKYTLKGKEDQNQWLVKALANSSSKWNIVFMHHPVYSSSHRHGVYSSGDDFAEYNAARLLEDKIKSKVKLVLVGHAHAYENILPQNGVQYFVSGAGAETVKKDADNQAAFHKCGEVEKLSFMLFSIKPGAITFWAIGENGEPFDAGVIQKN